MKALLDACVLYPPVLRAILLCAAEQGAYTPLWSPRICEEWARACAKRGPLDEVSARSASALMQARWPASNVRIKPSTHERLLLPDPNDEHVLAAAIDGFADVIVTFNLRDFPKAELAPEGLYARNPDAFLYQLWIDNSSPIEAAIDAVICDAAAMDGTEPEPRAFLKRAGLPKLGKALRR